MLRCESVAFDLFIDEHGNIDSPKSDDPYGYGFCLAERGSDADALRATLKAEFPSGLHMRGLHAQRRVSAAKKLANAFPRHPLFFAGAVVIEDAEYGARQYFESIAGVSGEGVKAAIQGAVVGDHGLVEPQSVLPEVYRVARKVAVYTHAIRLPLIALMQSPRCPKDVEIRVNLGVVGDAKRHESHLAKVLPLARESFRTFIQTHKPKGFAETLDITVASIEASDDPLFWVADATGSIGRRLAGEGDFGREMYDAARSIFESVPWNPADVVEPGVWRFGAQR